MNPRDVKSAICGGMPKNAMRRVKETAMVATDFHGENLLRVAALSNYWHAEMIAPLDIIAVLNRAGIRFVLVGVYGLAGWLNESRATSRVELVVATRQLMKARRVLTEAFSGLAAMDSPLVVHMLSGEQQRNELDLIKPFQPPYRIVFRHTSRAKAGDQWYRIPSLEMALVLIFAGMTSLYRGQADKHQDAHDFVLIVKNNPDPDRDRLQRLGQCIFAGGGKDVLQMVQWVRAGQKLSF